MQAWTGSIGPRQLKDLERAVGRLRTEGQSQIELSGVIGGREHQTRLWSPFGGCRDEVVEADRKIREKYSYRVTRENVREIIAAYQEATAEAAKNTPVDDQRRTKDEDDEIKAKVAAREAQYAAKRDAEQSLLDQVVARKPANAQALIVAQYNVDNSDTMTDYFSNQTQRTVAIGWRTGSREDFRQLHRAAAQFPETAHLASDEALDAWHRERDPEGRYPHSPGEGSERRDNYSMGKGNYLSDHGWDGAGSGWVVKSYALPARWVSLTEDAIPAVPAAPEAAAATVSGGGVTVRPSAQNAANVEVVFDAKPSAEVREALKAHRFRWSRYNGCWYGPDKAYAESLVKENA